MTDIRSTVAKADADNAELLPLMIAEGGICYIEDYSDIEQQVVSRSPMGSDRTGVAGRFPRCVRREHPYVSGAGRFPWRRWLSSRHGWKCGIAYTETEGVSRRTGRKFGWRKYYHPMDIGKRLAIVPSLAGEYDTDRVVDPDPALPLATAATRPATSLCSACWTSGCAAVSGC